MSDEFPDDTQSTVTETGGSGSMRLPSILTAATVETICDAMRAAKLDSFRNVTLDLSDVDICTSPGVQLLLALEKSLAESSGSLTITGVKPSVSGVLRDLGFERLLATLH